MILGLSGVVISVVHPHTQMWKFFTLLHQKLKDWQRLRQIKRYVLKKREEWRYKKKMHYIVFIVTTRLFQVIKLKPYTILYLRIKGSQCTLAHNAGAYSVLYLMKLVLIL